MSGENMSEGSVQGECPTLNSRTKDYTKKCDTASLGTLFQGQDQCHHAGRPKLMIATATDDRVGRTICMTSSNLVEMLQSLDHS